MKLSVAGEKFIQFCVVERHLSPHTCTAYRFDLADFEKWATVDLSQIATTDLKKYMEDMVKRKLSTATIRRRLACIRAFYHYTCEHIRIQNPFEGWRLRLARRKHLPRSLSKVETSTLLSTSTAPAQATDKAIGIAIRLMISTGLRVGELCSLKAEDVLSHGAALRVRGKGARDRIAYVSEEVLASELAAMAAQRTSNGALFLNRTGRPLRPNSVRSKLRKIAAKAGFRRRLTPHMLRHTAATLLIETGVDIRFVQRLLGHSSISTTEIYTHVSDEALRTTLAKANVLSTLA